MVSVAKSRNYLTIMLRAIRKRTNVKISILKSLRKENPNRLIFAQINLNSIKNKFQFLASQIINHVDVLLVSEIKLGDSFSRVLLEGFSKQCRLDHCSNGGEILLYVKDDIIFSFANRP